jgi:hypothetical protein
MQATWCHYWTEPGFCSITGETECSMDADGSCLRMPEMDYRPLPPEPGPSIDEVLERWQQEERAEGRHELGLRGE